MFASVQLSNPIHGTQIVVSKDRQVGGCIGNIGAVEIGLAEVGPEEKSVREDCAREACSEEAGCASAFPHASLTYTRPRCGGRQVVRDMSLPRGVECLNILRLEKEKCPSNSCCS